MRITNISHRSYYVWSRNFRSYLSWWWVKLVPPILEPVLYVLGFGYALGSLVETIDFEGKRVDYVHFIIPGVLALTIMLWAYFETLYGTYVRMEYQKIFKAMNSTPLLVEDIVVGEWLWAASKAMFAIFFMLIMLYAMNVISWPWGLGVLLVSIPASLMFSAMGLITSAISPSIDMFNVPMFAIIMPMFTFSGTFFPIDVLPFWARIVAYLLPLTPVSILLRGFCLGVLPHDWLFCTVYLLVLTTGLSWLSFKLMYRRLVK